MEVLRVVSVERLLESLLVEVVPDESDGSSEDKEGVEGADLEVLGRLFLGECARASEQIAEAGSDGTVDVEDEGLWARGLRRTRQVKSATCVNGDFYRTGIVSSPPRANDHDSHPSSRSSPSRRRARSRGSLCLGTLSWRMP